MARLLLDAIGGWDLPSHPPMSLSALDEWVSHLTAHAIEQSTQKGYSTSIKSYIHFCMIHNLPLNPTPQNLACYIAYVSQYINSGPQYLSGICHFLLEFFPNFDNNCSSTLVQATIRGSKKVWDNPIHQKLPLWTSHLQTFHNLAKSSNSYDNLLFITIISCAFHGCHRIRELIQKNDQSLFDWRKIIKRASLSFPDGYYVQYHLPYHKSDPFYHGTDVHFVPQAIADPSLCSNSTVIDMMHIMVSALLYSFTRTDLTPPILGLNIDSTVTSLIPTELILCMLAAPHSMLHWDSMNQSFNLLDAGLHLHGRFTSVTTPPSELHNNFLFLLPISSSLHLSHHHLPHTHHKQLFYST